MSDASPPPLGQMLRDFADFVRPSAWLGPAPDSSALPRGDGHAVLVAPGIFCSDLITAATRRFLRELGYDVHGWEQGINFGPFPAAMRGLRDQLFALHARSGRRVSLVGKSLGGMMVRELAKLHPERVRSLAVICSPIRHPVPNQYAPVIDLLRGHYDQSIPASDEELSRPAPVPTLACYTKQDGILAWQCCLEDPGALARNVELVGGWHTTSGMHPAALTALAEHLARPDRPAAV